MVRLWRIPALGILRLVIVFSMDKHVGLSL